MNQKVLNELTINKEKNEIFYSLSRYDILSIQKLLLEKKKDSYIDVVISFNSREIASVFHLLSTTYSLPNREEMVKEIWENFLANKILDELAKKTPVYFAQNLKREKALLESFDIQSYLLHFQKRTTIRTIQNITLNQIEGKMRVHYFPSNVVVPIDLQKIIGKLFSTPLAFSNMLYTTQDSIHSYYKQGNTWIVEQIGYQEIWKSYANLKGKQILWD